jgi:ABC-2 type transport system permease protein
MKSFRGAWAICKRELHSYFVSPVAYALLAIFWLAEGVFFVSILNFWAAQGRNADARAQEYGVDGNLLNVPAMVTGSFLDVTALVLVFVIPIIAMGLLSEEKRRGTLDLLLTSPVSNGGILWGKFLGAYTFLLFMLTPPFLFQFVMAHYGSNEPGMFATGFLGLALMCAAMLAAALWVSSITKNQVVSAFAGYGTLLVFWFIDAPANLLPTVWQDAARWLSINDHFGDFRVGVVSLRDLNYFLWFLLFFLFLTHTALESIRWRGVRSS